MIRDEAYFKSLTEQIIGCAYAVGNSLGHGFLEKVYENALAHEIEKSGFKVSRQHPIKVLYDRTVVGEYFLPTSLWKMKSSSNLRLLKISKIPTWPNVSIT